MVARDKKYLYTPNHMPFFLKIEFSHYFHISNILVKKIRKGINKTLRQFEVAGGAGNRQLYS
jgi:hypothetical protein